MARQLEDILLTYPRVRVAHGDFKSTNFIVGDDQPVTIDLDSIRSFRLARLFRDTYLRDLERFQRNWGHSPSATALFTPMIEQIRQTCLSTQP